MGKDSKFLFTIMPTYNQAKFLERALVAVYPMSDKLVIVNDGSTDATEGILEEYAALKNITVLHQKPNAGAASAINTGFKFLLSQVDDYKKTWISWVSSDNVQYPNWRDYLFSGTAEDVGVVYSGFSYGSSNRTLFTPFDPNRLINNLNCFYGPSFIIRSDVWAETGDHRGRISHDYDHWLRIEETCSRKNLKIVGLPESTCLYNVHDERATVRLKHQYDADFWQTEAKSRRKNQ